MVLEAILHCRGSISSIHDMVVIDEEKMSRWDTECIDSRYGLSIIAGWMCQGVVHSLQVSKCATNRSHGTLSE